MVAKGIPLGEWQGIISSEQLTYAKIREFPDYETGTKLL